VFEIALRNIRPDPEAIARKSEPLLFATDLADYLTARGVPFREAHGAVGALVRSAENEGRALTALTTRDFQAFHPLFGADVRRVFDPARSVRRKKGAGSTHPARVKDQIRRAKALCGT
jgi:argininosuccinate lyase